uniref:Uncharacterized protein n=1 Tax=Cannabis sativa TaxID=3483 RepID=A0A803NZT6_CANSA
MGSQEIKAKPAPKLSKSEKKKMKKLEEEKEKALLLTKSLKILQKYTIPDGAYSLLKSTRNIVDNDEPILSNEPAVVDCGKSANKKLKVDPKCSRCGGGFKEDIILAIWKCSSNRFDSCSAREKYFSGVSVLYVDKNSVNLQEVEEGVRICVV